MQSSKQLIKYLTHSPCRIYHLTFGVCDLSRSSNDKVTPVSTEEAISGVWSVPEASLKETSWNQKPSAKGKLCLLPPGITRLLVEESRKLNKTDSNHSYHFPELPEPQTSHTLSCSSHSNPVRWGPSLCPFSSGGNWVSQWLRPAWTVCQLVSGRAGISTPHRLLLHPTLYLLTSHCIPGPLPAISPPPKGSHTPDFHSRD